MKDLADKIAAEIMRIGGEHGSPCKRIEFKSADEKPQGGFCEIALARTIREAIAKECPQRTGHDFGQLRAFPVPGAQGEGGNGATIRTLLAGMAMQGFCANSEVALSAAKLLNQKQTPQQVAAQVANAAIIHADALLEALAKDQE